eukprot:15467608-Alexandrium_andersonii.AAC.1
MPGKGPGGGSSLPGVRRKVLQTVRSWQFWGLQARAPSCCYEQFRQLLVHSVPMSSWGAPGKTPRGSAGAPQG